jgi:hypothetical protein
MLIDIVVILEVVILLRILNAYVGIRLVEIFQMVGVAVQLVILEIMND